MDENTNKITGEKVKKKILVISGLLLLFTLSSCIKPYKKPILMTISPSQTAFLIDLEGNTKNKQASFASEEFLKEKKVATKRIELNQRWLQTGRRSWSGKWIPTQELIIVERKPATREWTARPDTGTSSKDEGIEAESMDSIGFIIGMACTATIREENSPKFLYFYSGKTLEQVMDSEIRPRIESKFIEECGKLALKEVIISKAVILDKVRNEVIHFFETEAGVTITNLGYKGQIQYSDPKIQAAINQEFIASKQRAAQKETNLMEIERAQAEAKAVSIRASTISNQIRLKELEIKEKFIEKWDGQLSQYSMGNNDIIMQMFKN